jgi:hypothetical protein
MDGHGSVTEQKRFLRCKKVSEILYLNLRIYISPSFDLQKFGPKKIVIFLPMVQLYFIWKQLRNIFGLGTLLKTIYNPFITFAKNSKFKIDFFILLKKNSKIQCMKDVSL